MSGTVEYQLKQNIALLKIANPPVNALSAGVRQGLYKGLETALNDSAVEAIILYSDGKIFISGADISEFGKPMANPVLTEVLAYMDNSSKPIIGAINGTAFGGGLETALCCDYRIGYRQALLGLPEVKLGLLPGAGGTQRLPRLVGIKQALSMILSGEPITGEQGIKLGLLDRLSDSDLLTDAINFANEIIANGANLRKVSQISIPSSSTENDQAFAASKKWIDRFRYGQFAPTMIIECVQQALTANTFADGLKNERERFVKCLEHPQRAAMIYGFFSERQANKHPQISKQTQTDRISTVAVIGAGTMGFGISKLLVEKGLSVFVVDINKSALAQCQKRLENSFNKGIEQQHYQQAQVTNYLKNINYISSISDIPTVDLIIESATEDLTLKIDLFKKLYEHNNNAYLVTNTSSLAVNSIADQLPNSQRYAGLHFFNPADQARLVEITAANNTSPETLATLQALCKKLTKVSVFTNDSPGFIVNRILIDLLEAVFTLVSEGTKFTLIDDSLSEFGMSIGPFKTCDLVGLDIISKVYDNLVETNRTSLALLSEIQEKVGDGRKTGRGFYQYDADNFLKPCNDTLTICTNKSNSNKESIIDPKDIIDYCMAVMVNSASKLLQNNIVNKPSDIDIAAINGFGFPVFRGGPLYYAEQQGIKNINTIYQKHLKEGRLNSPLCSLLTDLENTNGSFFK